MSAQTKAGLPVEPYLTAKELARVLKIKEGTIRHWTSELDIPVIRLGGRLVRYQLSEVDKWVRSGGAERSRKRSGKRKTTPTESKVLGGATVGSAQNVSGVRLHSP